MNDTAEALHTMPFPWVPIPSTRQRFLPLFSPRSGMVERSVLASMGAVECGHPPQRPAPGPAPAQLERNFGPGTTEGPVSPSWLGSCLILVDTQSLHRKPRHDDQFSTSQFSFSSRTSPRS